MVVAPNYSWSSPKIALGRLNSLNKTSKLHCFIDEEEFEIWRFSSLPYVHLSFMVLLP